MRFDFNKMLRKYIFNKIVSKMLIAMIYKYIPMLIKHGFDRPDVADNYKMIAGALKTQYEIMKGPPKSTEIKTTA